MGAIFAPDSKFMQAMARVSDLVILNLLFLLSCVPLITIGAASAALYTVCFRIGTDREQGVCRSYFRAFRENFRQGTILWLIAVVFLVPESSMCFCSTPWKGRFITFSCS